MTSSTWIRLSAAYQDGLIERDQEDREEHADEHKSEFACAGSRASAKGAPGHASDTAHSLPVKYFASRAICSGVLSDAGASSASTDFFGSKSLPSDATRSIPGAAVVEEA